MNHSEYLRRKLESLPKTYGRSQLGDESMRTMVQRMSATKYNARRSSNNVRTSTCCQNGGPYGKEGSGQQQEWGYEDKNISCICSTWKLTTPITRACCPQESTPEIPRDANGVPTNPMVKAAAYQGRATCCPVVGKKLSALAPDCSCKNGPGFVDTWKANNVPYEQIPVAPAVHGCCQKEPANNPPTNCCDCEC